jgi:hypothetical protein
MVTEELPLLGRGEAVPSLTTTPNVVLIITRRDVSENCHNVLHCKRGGMDPQCSYISKGRCRVVTPTVGPFIF